MQRLIGFIFIPLWVLSFVISMVLMITFYIIPSYKYPFNSFSKVAQTMSLSKNHHNLIYIMPDMTNGFDITSVLQSDATLSANFTGFTNYQNLITTNWGTNASVPNIFAGYDYNTYYKNHGPMSNITFRAYMKKAMNVLISAFGSAKWDISEVANQYYDYNPVKSYWDSNWQALQDDFKQYDVQAINANDISRLLYYQKPSLYKELGLPSKLFNISSNGNFISIIPYLSQANIVNTTNNKYIQIMDEATHGVVVMDANGHYLTNGTNSPTNIYNTFKGFLKQINDLITYLKVNGIYDNTMIVINSDHGYGEESLVLQDPSYNHTGIDYSAITNILAKHPGFNRYFPTLLVKPYNDNNPLTFNNSNLYTNTDALTFIKEYNKAGVNFTELDKTQDIRYLKQLSDISLRSNVYMPTYGNDTLWNDAFIHYLLPQGRYAGESYIVKNDIYNINNWLINKDNKDYYNPDDLADWVNV